MYPSWFSCPVALTDEAGIFELEVHEVCDRTGMHRQNQF